ncbi:hypothetical protein G911_03980 [Escherichia coli UMEA 3121-1]|uniref:Uncharacterized protein n=1 Tax=Escherichia coli O6:K15:H31 (strain 536 / UPEC) TaxID=362663 RepID=A0A454A9L5_ECOL5|nr:hypothetical protein ECP_3808 [Escherichia coli 536]EQW48597.1 hypothetical protein G905_03954 [Escherichia coli UMEA 3087-1]EQW75709.1 hypothetical protein G911_03980 [Escherichia coli UMEA 3121-1]EQY39175.1 hypothetical protein G949_04020 [Escherichia coli UMEA 3222-1]
MSTRKVCQNFSVMPQLPCFSIDKMPLLILLLLQSVVPLFLLPALTDIYPDLLACKIK